MPWPGLRHSVISVGRIRGPNIHPEVGGVVFNLQQASEQQDGLFGAALLLLQVLVLFECLFLLQSPEVGDIFFISAH